MEDKKLFQLWRDRIRDNIWLADTGCWIWTKATNNRGYTVVGWRIDGRQIGTGHVASWMAFNEHRIPQGLQVHHTCEVITCVNPDHLMLVTASDNIRLKNGGTMDFCKRGHPRIQLGKCRECTRYRYDRRRSK